MFKRNSESSHRRGRGSAARKPRLSWTLAAAVVALQACILATLAVTTRWQPPRVRIIESGWVWMQDATLYLLLLLLVGGPVFTWLACSIDKRKRGVLTLAWVGFTLTLVLAFGAEAQYMMRTLWAQMPV